MHRIALFLPLVSAGCFVKVPDIDRGDFACRGDGDCAGGYVCLDGLCKPKGTNPDDNQQTTQLPCGGSCGSGKVCASFSNGPAQCVSDCASCTGASQTCTAVDGFGANGQATSVGACLTCQPACATGDQCGATADVAFDSAQPTCACDATACPAVKGAGFRCISETCTAACSPADPTCPASTVCSKTLSQCVKDCSPNGPSPGSCGTTERCMPAEVLPSRLLEICLPDPCLSVSCALGCFVRPVVGDAVCLTTADECVASGQCGATSSCVWDGSVDRIGSCADNCPIGGECATGALCRGANAYDALNPTLACLDRPPGAADGCSGTCDPGSHSDTVCVFADSGRQKTACRQGCRTDDDCAAGKLCVRDSRNKAGLDGDIGLCGTPVDPATCPGVCASGYTCWNNNARRLIAGTFATVCVPRVEDPCSAASCANAADACVLTPFANTFCYPRCELIGPACPAGTECVQAMSFMPPPSNKYQGWDQVCFRTADRYPTAELATPVTGFSGFATSAEDTRLFLNPTNLVRVERGGDTHMLLAYGANPAPRSDIYEVLGAPVARCTFNAAAHLGVGELDGAARVIRLLAECPGGQVAPTTPSPCVQSSDPYLYAARVGPTSCDLSPFTLKAPAGNPGTSFVMGDIGDGYLVAVLAYPGGAFGIRVGELVANADPPVAWMRQEMFFPSGSEIKHVQVSREIVAWSVRDGSGTLPALEYAQLRGLAQSNRPQVTRIQPRADSMSGIDDFDLDNHWLAWAEETPYGVAGRYVATVQDGATLPAPSELSIIGTGMPQYHTPSLHRHYLAWTVQPDVVHLRELVTSNLDKSYTQVSKNGLLLPLLFMRLSDADVWYLQLDVSDYDRIHFQ